MGQRTRSAPIAGLKPGGGGGGKFESPEQHIPRAPEIAGLEPEAHGFGRGFAGAAGGHGIVDGQLEFLADKLDAQFDVLVVAVAGWSALGADRAVGGDDLIVAFVADLEIGAQESDARAHPLDDVQVEFK